MKKIILLALALTMVIAAPSLAAKITTTAITHTAQVYQAECGSSVCFPGTAAQVGPMVQCFRGYCPSTGDAISSVPGILCLIPGGSAWPNFIEAAQDRRPLGHAPVSYTIKNTTFVKQTPSFVQCHDIFPAHTVTQQGTPNIRLWWPLMYEVPSTTFTLTILYGTPDLFDDDGPTGPNPPSWVHVEQWVWHVDADLPHLKLLLELFHELPFGKDEVPLISDEDLYIDLQDKLSDAIVAFGNCDTATAASILTDFEMEVMDACITVSPMFPNPSGPCTGIANTDENPACCKLLVDVEYIGQTSGIFGPSK